MRQAIAAANATTSDDIINFDATVFSTQRTITLTSDLLSITNNGTLMINGTGANLLTISGNNLRSVFMVGTGTTAFINNLTITAGRGGSGSGGGITNRGTLTLTNLTINSSSSDGGGGGVYNLFAVLNIVNSTISNNTAREGGGGLYNEFDSTVNLTNSTISNNSADGFGGGVANVNGTLNVTGSTIAGNTARTVAFGSGGCGGGIHSQGGPLSVTTSTVSGNSAQNCGGGINNASNAIGNSVITSSTINGNSAIRGGGINNSIQGNITINNSTVSNNSANEGGGLYNILEGVINLNNSTISQNAAMSNTYGGGGVRNEDVQNQQNPSIVNVRNTIIADNTDTSTTSPDFGGRLTSQGYNLIENTSATNILGNTTGNITGQDPRLAPLANNGGATQTHALLTGSLAIDAADPTNFLLTDQRGINRPQDGDGNGTARADIGAFELQGNNIELQFSTVEYTVSENAGSALLTVTRSGGSSGTATVDFATADGTARQRTDYTLASGTLNFAAGETSKTLTVLITDDRYAESAENLTVTLSNPNGATLGTPATATINITDDDPATSTTNPIDETRFFVTQQYNDFLSRAPDAGGLAFWINEIDGGCAPTDATCINRRRVEVSAQFFIELEFQRTGSYVYRLYRAAFGDNQPFAVAPTLTDGLKLPSYAVFAPDRARINPRAEVINQSLQDLAANFVARSAFVTRYPTTQTNEQFVDALIANIQSATGANLSSQRAVLLSELAAGGRGRVLYRLAQDDAQNNPVNNRAFISAEFNRAFVLMQYFGYLRRNPDIGGYNFWLNVLNGQGLNGQRFMVCNFITSQEYQERFSPISSRNNNLCSTLFQ